jgi:hypothetical protein
MNPTQQIPGWTDEWTGAAQRAGCPLDNFVGYTGPEELAALLSACYDGNSNQIIDEDSSKNSYGMAKTETRLFLKLCRFSRLNPGMSC